MVVTKKSISENNNKYIVYNRKSDETNKSYYVNKNKLHRKKNKSYGTENKTPGTEVNIPLLFIIYACSDKTGIKPPGRRDLGR